MLLVLRDCYQRTLVRCQRYCCCCTGGERHVIYLQHTEDSLPQQQAAAGSCSHWRFTRFWFLLFFMMFCVLKTTSFARNLHAHTHILVCAINSIPLKCLYVCACISMHIEAHAFCKFVSVALEMQHLYSPCLFGMWMECR